MPFTRLSLTYVLCSFGPEGSWLTLRSALGLRSPVRRVEPDGPYRCRVYWGDEDGEEVKPGPLGRHDKTEPSKP